MKKIYIYKIDTLEVVAEPAITSYEEFKSNPSIFYPDWDLKLNLASETKFANPILESELIREKTREELIILDNSLELLISGEFIENGKILKKEVPKEMLKAKWEIKNKTWVESATKKDVENETNKLIDEFIVLSEKREKLEKYGFNTTEIEKKIKANELRRNEILKIKII